MENLNFKYMDYVFIDEAGRGCVGGELVFTGVKIKPNGNVDMANDSKKLTFKQRESMVHEILQNVEHCTVITSAEEIDKIGLSKAIQNSLETIIKYFETLYVDVKFLYDGNKTFGVMNENLTTLVKADALVKGVGAASIIAKHNKDILMLQHHNEYPEYGFNSNFGYITKAHVEAIKQYGYTKYHRKSYKIKELESTQSSSAEALF